MGIFSVFLRKHLDKINDAFELELYSEGDWAKELIVRAAQILVVNSKNDIAALKVI